MPKTLNTAAVSKAMDEQGLTQKELAHRVGVSSQAVTNWMKRKDFPRPPALLKLATLLRLGFDDLVEVVKEGRPVVAFRKKGNAKTTAVHIAKADAIGMLLKPLVPFLNGFQALRTTITSPSIEYDKLEIAVSQTRKRLGIGERAVLSYEHLISDFSSNGAVLVPVLWGKKGNHENALHIHLPEEDVTFIFLNLDTRLEDFKFWMAHELAHVFTPDRAGTEEGEDYADAFAGALLFPRVCAEAVYCEAVNKASEKSRIRVLHAHAESHMISLNTVYQQVNKFAKAEDLPPLGIEETAIHAVRNSHQGEFVSEALFAPMPPEPSLYISVCEKVFQSDFFHALKRMILETGTGPSYVQQVLDTPLQDAHALHEVLHR